MLILVLNQKENVCLLSSDFHSENPLTQTRTFHTQNRYLQAKKTHIRIKLKSMGLQNYNEIKPNLIN